jgi:hypothetical protein
VFNIKVTESNTPDFEIPSDEGYRLISGDDYTAKIAG